jgi:hypothetical protein
MNSLKFYLTLVLFAVSGYFVLQRAFSESQSVILSLCFAWLLTNVITLAKASSEFKPYRMWITYNPYAILTDMGLLEPETETEKAARISAFREARLTSYKTPERFESLWKGRDFKFVAITPQLFACSDAGQLPYFKYLNIEDEIPLKVDWQQEGRYVGVGDSPKFFLERAAGGYKFGVRVANKEWWETAKQKAVPSLQSLTIPADYTAPEDKLVLAFLPDGYTNHVRNYWEPVGWLNRWNPKQRLWTKRLAALGWKVEANEPRFIEHKYVSVDYSSLDGE